MPIQLGERTATESAKRRFLWLFGVQTVGVAILLMNGVPLFREMSSDPASHVPQPEVLVWELTSIALMQFGYWPSYRIPTPRPKNPHALLGHIVQFFCRMTFVFATSVFGFAFITKESGFSVPGFRSIVTVVALFSFFCYTKEAERLGIMLESGKESENQDSPTRKAA